jgi:two-component system LytT family response regulator
MPRVLLIDDEPPACDILRALLGETPDIAVVGEAGTLATARTLLGTSDYDLVFLDIQLRGGTGFDLVPLVRPGARIIFVTAYDQHALRAFEVNALDYLLKPIAPERLAAALARLSTGSPLSTSNPQLSTPTPPLTPDDRVLLKLGAGNERFVRLADIRCITSEENYSAVHVGAPAERLLVRRTLQSWEDQLPASHFVRVHRQAIVNPAHARGLTRITEDVSHLTLEGLAEPVAVSQRYLPALRARLPAA